MTTRPHDALFKAAFEDPAHLAQLCRELLAPPLAAAIEWASAAHEPASFIDPELADRHGDLLLSVDLDGQPAYLYLLVEHQSSRDPTMALRVLVYITRIWERHVKQVGLPLPPIISIVLAHAPGAWVAPSRFHELVVPAPKSIPGLAEFTPEFSVLVEDLSARHDEQLRARALAAFPKLALWLLRDGRSGAFMDRFDAWAPVMRQMLHAPNGAAAMAQLLRYISLVAGEQRFVDVYTKIRQTLPEAEDTIMTIAEQLRQEGREQGLEQGQMLALRETVTKLITLKFGPVSCDNQAIIEHATTPTLTRYIEQILSASDVDALLRGSEQPTTGS